MNCYTILKRTSNHADTLAAIGAADVLRHLDPQIVELDDRFEIRFRKRLLSSDLEAVDPGFSYLERPRKTSPRVTPERLIRSRGTNSVDPAAQQTSALDNRMYSILGRMKAYGGPNKLISRFAKMRREQWTTSVWECFQGTPGFVFRSPLVQLFNPHSGKGYALLKPTGTNRNDKTKDRWAEPFHEWLRFRGYFEGGAGWFTSGDLRFFCPIPADIAYEQFAAAAGCLRDLRLGGTAAKIDCRAVLGLTRAIIEGASTYHRPRRSVRGLWAAHYKDMGQAHTIISMEQLSIPDWFELRNAQERERWLATLDEHDTVVRRLTDNHSEEFELLKQYRRIFQDRWDESVSEFVEFLAGYGALLFKRRARDHWQLPQFTTEGVISILERDPDLRKMLRNPGFLAIAAAIRSSTVGAQAARYRGRFQHREIRYGLFGEVRRAGSIGVTKLIDRVVSFIAEFNREGAIRRGMGLRSSRIQNGELEAFGAALQRMPFTIRAGSLLCGFSACIPGTAAAVQNESEIVQAISA
jgi:hypothetical protein